jgi:hypothetical protein
MDEPEYPVRLNTVLIRTLLLGAHLRTDRDLAETLGIDPTRLSRALNGRIRLPVSIIDPIVTFWPNVPYERLVLRPDEEDDTPQTYGLTDEDMATVAGDAND